MRFFSYSRVALVSTCLIIGLSAAVFMAQQRPANPPAAGSGQSPVERGKYLVLVQDCNGCHTPFKNGEPDMTRMLSGHPQDAAQITAAPKLPEGWVTAISTTNTGWSTPAGVAFTTNLTPDKATGIGGWTDETFINAIRKGKHLGLASGRDILPPMPWKMYSNLTDADLKAIFAYLKTVPAISNKVPNPILPAGKK